MLISRSLGRKLLATSVVAVAFVLMYETKVMDFRYIERVVETADLTPEVGVPPGGMHLRFTATAYCKGTTTASGVNVRTGIAAADLEAWGALQRDLHDYGHGTRRPGAPH
jgi:hypothetical protein